MTRRPPLAIKVGIVMATTTAIGVAVFDSSLEAAPGFLIGVPWMAWLIHRHR